METETVVVESVELTASEKNMEVSSAHHIAQSLADSLNLAYWFFDRDNFTANYHAQNAVARYDELTKRMKAAGLIQ